MLGIINCSCRIPLTLCKVQKLAAAGRENFAFSRVFMHPGFLATVEVYLRWRHTSLKELE